MSIYFWQQTQWAQILSSFQDGRFPHALLLTGTKDMGKLAFAQILTKKLLCHNQHGPLACSVCRACQLLAEGSHPDLILIQPETEDGNIKIEPIRALVEELAQTGQQSSRRVVVIEPAEAMNRAAANALLKTLEEPSSNTLFLLVSHQPGLLPATVLSRCQKMIFPVPSTTTSLTWLQEQLPLLTQVELTLLLSMAENIPLRALAFYNANSRPNYDKITVGLLECLLEKSSPLEMASLCANIDFTTVFNALWWISNQLLRLKWVSTAPAELNQNLKELLSQASERITSFMLFQLIEKLLNAKKQVVANKISLNKQLLFEDILTL